MATTDFIIAPSLLSANFAKLGEEVANIAGVDAFVGGSAVFGAGKESDKNRYNSVISALRGELDKIR